MKNLRVMANAGSGKTYALTNRVIALLAMGAEPKDISALTFTRKAAGEFLDGTLLKLALACEDPVTRSNLERGIRTHQQVEPLSEERCSDLLLRVTQQLPELGMGTIDSFFGRLAKTFSAECGLPEGFAIADPATWRATRTAALGAVFHTASASQLHVLIEILRQAARRDGERDVFGSTLRLLDSLHADFVGTSNLATWGNASLILDPAPADFTSTQPISTAATAFLNTVKVQQPDLHPEAMTSLSDFLDELLQLEAGGVWSPASAKAFAKLCVGRPKQKEIRLLQKKVGWLFFCPDIHAVRVQLRDAVTTHVVETYADRTRALSALLHLFDREFLRLLDIAAISSFSFITNSLAALTRRDQWLSEVGYRTDQRFQHWLLDEFQDTDRTQWQVLREFIDEVVMDPTGERSFFYVGDVKQAIYGWRGGDSDLFYEVFEAYRGGIEDSAPLAQSWRSCPQIVDFTNKIFGDVRSLAPSLSLSEQTVQKWLNGWADHQSSPGTISMDGYVQWRPLPAGDSVDETSRTQEDEVLTILNRVRPWERGLTCAVLHRKNQDLASLALRAEASRIPVLVEGKTHPCMDNPLGVALLLAVRFLKNPDDKLALLLLRGFPVAKPWGLEEPQAFHRQQLATLARHGFARWSEELIALAPLAGDPFLEKRGQQIQVAIEEFERNRKPADGLLNFYNYLEEYQTQDTDSSGRVRLMTVHQAKGLGFDMVIVYGLDSSSSSNRPLLLNGNSREGERWALLAPPKDVCLSIPSLADSYNNTVNRQQLNELCTSYVAITRAKQALYVLSKELKAKSTAKHFGRMLNLTIGPSAYANGNPEWFTSHRIRHEKTMEQEEPLSLSPPSRHLPRPIRPSRMNGAQQTPSKQAELGTEIHRLLALVSWLDELNMPTGEPEAITRVKTFFDSPAGRDVFTRPKSAVRLLREQPFDVSVHGEWMSGVFDRVHLMESLSGSIQNVIVFDFKSGQETDDLSERYREQVELYRKAARELFQISDNQLTVQLISV